MCSFPLASYSSGELHVLGHDGNSLGVDGEEVGVIEETNEVCLSCLLEAEDSGALPSEVLVDISRDIFDESLEGELFDEELGGLLETSDVAESDGAGSESVGLLDTTSWNGGSLLPLAFAFAFGLNLASRLSSPSAIFATLNLYSRIIDLLLGIDGGLRGLTATGKRIL